MDLQSAAVSLGYSGAKCADSLAGTNRAARLGKRVDGPFIMMIGLPVEARSLTVAALLGIAGIPKILQ